MSKKLITTINTLLVVAALSVPVVAQTVQPIAATPIQEAQEEMVPLTPAHMTIQEATVIAIDMENLQVTVLPKDMEDHPYNYIVLNISEKTLLSAGVAVGDTVNVKHDTMMTRSLPPQTPAFEIVEVTEKVAPEDVVTKDEATIITIDEEINYITILPKDMENEPYNYVVLRINEDTLVSASLKEGDCVNVEHSAAMTRSLPPQTGAYKIVEVVQEVVLPEVMTIDCAMVKEVNVENGKVAILPEGAEDNPMNYIVLNTSVDTTNVYHEVNKRIYHVEDLKEGMEVMVKHSPLMTLSLPPQTAALEITILQSEEKAY